MPGLDIATARFLPLPGHRGWVLRFPHAVSYAAGPGGTGLSELVGVCRQAASPAEVVGRVVARLSRPEAAALPPFALVTSPGPELLVLVHGEAPLKLERSDGPDLHLTAEGPGMWFTRTVGDVTRVVLGFAEGEPEPADLADPAAGEWSDLQAGVLPADGAVMLVPAGAAEAAPGPGPVPAEPAVLGGPSGVVAAPEGPVEPAAEAAPFPPPAAEDETVVDAPAAGAAGAPGADVWGAEPTPGAGSAGVRVKGRYCERHHFNAPRDRWCRVCGLPLNQDPGAEVEGIRPPLGALLWDNGDSDPIERDTIVGRDPSSDGAVSAGTVASLTPRGQSEGMSRIHAELRLVEWEVLLSDRGSTNGTFVWDEPRQAWHRLEAGEHFPLRVGSIVAFGERTATFEAAPDQS